MDTISAVCTAVGEGAVGIIRISGPDSLPIAREIFRPKRSAPIGHSDRHKLLYGHIYDRDALIDEVLCVYMPAPRSYTREDVIEIHGHGGRSVLQKILLLTLRAGARLAEPGEFTKRAFLHGRIDLTQAEAVMSLIRATGETALRQAAQQQQGFLARTIQVWRADLKKLLAQAEACIDYPEEDIEGRDSEDMLAALDGLRGKIASLLGTAPMGRIIKEGLRVTMVGKPNVGKSSLLNKLVGHEAALVTEFAGTTRDSIEEQVFLDGMPVLLVDTAGLRRAGEAVERLGIARSREKIQRADLLLLVLDASRALDEEDLAVLPELAGRPYLVALNKSDLAPRLSLTALRAALPCADKDIVRVCALDKTGWPELLARIKDKLYEYGPVAGEGIYIQEARHQEHLGKAHAALAAACGALTGGLPRDCVLLDAKECFDELGMITGETAGDEIIREIFAGFCLGK